MPSHITTLTPSRASSYEDPIVSFPEEPLVHRRRGIYIAFINVKELTMTAPSIKVGHQDITRGSWITKDSRSLMSRGPKMPAAISIILDINSYRKKRVFTAFNSDVKVIPPLTSTLVSFTPVYILIGSSS